jgi:hypothetical protein
VAWRIKWKRRLKVSKVKRNKEKWKRKNMNNLKKEKGITQINSGPGMKQFSKKK